jgi:hypothetical protein
MIRSALLEHPNIVVHHELFSPYPGDFHPYPFNESAKSILENYAFRAFHSQINAVGFPINEHHCNEENSPQWASVWSELTNMPDLKVIRLKRKNLLRAFVSRMTATHTHQWTIYPNNTRHHQGVISINIDAKSLEAIFIKNTRRYEYFDQLFGHLSSLELVYENMCADFPNEYNRVQSFLGVNYIDSNPTTKKQAVGPISDSLPNYYVLKDYFSGSRWADFFDE